MTKREVGRIIRLSDQAARKAAERIRYLWHCENEVQRLLLGGEDAIKHG